MTNEIVILIGVAILAVAGFITFVSLEDSRIRADEIKWRKEVAALRKSGQYFRDLLSEYPPPTASPTASASYSWSESPSASPSPSVSISPSPSEEIPDGDISDLYFGGAYIHPAYLLESLHLDNKRKPASSPKLYPSCHYCRMPLEPKTMLCTHCGAPQYQHGYDEWGGR